MVKRSGESLKGRDKLCNSGHFATGVGKDYLTLAGFQIRGLAKTQGDARDSLGSSKAYPGLANASL
ncbi:MAG: hypothetical protein V3T83_06470, partial [Acidobacteriota bacterium]